MGALAPRARARGGGRSRSRGRRRARPGSAAHLGEHLDDAKKQSFAGLDLLFIVSPLDPAHVEQSAALHGRSACYAVESGAVVTARATGGFSYVEWDRHRGSA